jgi:hypothetical protein
LLFVDGHRHWLYWVESWRYLLLILLPAAYTLATYRGLLLVQGYTCAQSYYTAGGVGLMASLPKVKLSPRRVESTINANHSQKRSYIYLFALKIWQLLACFEMRKIHKVNASHFAEKTQTLTFVTYFGYVIATEGLRMISAKKYTHWTRIKDVRIII